MFLDYFQAACPYDAAAFAEGLARVQGVVDELNLQGYANLGSWVRAVVAPKVARRRRSFVSTETLLAGTHPIHLILTRRRKALRCCTATQLQRPGFLILHRSVAPS